MLLAGSYGFADWPVSDADWQVTRDYYSQSVNGGLMAAEIDAWRPYANVLDQNYNDGFYNPPVSPLLGNQPLARLGYIDVSAAPFNAMPNDGVDDTMALQDAINYARDHQMAAFLPGGIYNISDTIQVAHALMRNSDGSISGGMEEFNCVVVGDTSGPTRAKLVLADNTFTNLSAQKFAVYLLRPSDVKKGGNPLNNGGTTHYANYFGSIDIDLGNNPAAWGLSAQGAEGTSVQDVCITATGARGGVRGISGSGGAMFDISVLGGVYGVYAYDGGDETLAVGATSAQPGPTLTNFKLLDQTGPAIVQNVRGALTFVGGEIRSLRTGGPVIESYDRWWKEPFNATVCLIDTRIEYAAPDANNIVIGSMRNGAYAAPERSFYIENTYIKNASLLTKNGVGFSIDSLDNGWTFFRQAAYDRDTYSTKSISFAGYDYTLNDNENVFINGMNVGAAYVDATDGAAPPVELTTKHALGHWATFKTPGVVNVKDYGAVGDGDVITSRDDTAAIQAAINAAGDNGVVFLPKGYYRVSGTLTLKRNTTLIGVHHKYSQIHGSDTDARRFGNNADPIHVGLPIVSTVDAADAAPCIGFLGILPDFPLNQHDPRPIGVYALELKSGQSKIRLIEAKNNVTDNYWEYFVLKSGGSKQYGVTQSLVNPNYQDTDLSYLDPRYGWEKQDPTGPYGDYGNTTAKTLTGTPTAAEPGHYWLSPIIHPLIQVRNNGGGQWFQFWNHGYDNVSDDWRIIKVENAGNGLKFYHMHMQHKRSDAQASFVNSSSIDVYGTKQEIHTRFLDIINSDHIRIHGYAGIGTPYWKGAPLFYIDKDSRDILITNIGDEPDPSSPSSRAGTNRSGLWNANITDYTTIWDDSFGTRVSPPTDTSRQTHAIMYMTGDPLGVVDFVKPPTSLQATPMFANRIDLHWTDNATNELGYVIQRATDGLFTQNLVVFNAIANVTNYSDTSTVSDIPYYYRVKAVNAMSGDTSNIVLTTALTSPQSALATVVSSSRIDLAWTNTASNATAYIIERANDPTFMENFKVFACSVTSFSDTGLNPSTVYYYRVRATNAGGQSLASTTIAAQTQMASPSGLAATLAGTGPYSVNLAWKDNTTGETGYKVERCANAAFTGTVVFVTTTRSLAFSHSETNVPDGTWYYRVRATNSSGDTLNSNVASVLVPGSATIPMAPSGLSAVAASSSHIDLTWTDNSANETGFKIERATDPAFSQNLTLLATTAVNITTYADTTMPTNAASYYRVRAANTAGDSANSAAAVAVSWTLTLGNDERTVRLGSGGAVQFFDNAVSTIMPIFSVPDALLQSVYIDGKAGDDMLTVDFASGNPAPAGGIVFDGGAHEMGDTLLIVGTSNSDAVTWTDSRAVWAGQPAVIHSNVEFAAFDLGAGSDQLGVDGAALKIGQDNAISDNTAVTIRNNGVLDLNGHTEAIAALVLESGSLIHGVTNAASYTLANGLVTAQLGRGAVIKQTAGAVTVTTPLAATTLHVQAGQLTAFSVNASGLTIAAGAQLVIAPGSPTSVIGSLTISLPSTTTSKRANVSEPSPPVAKLSTAGEMRSVVPQIQHSTLEGLISSLALQRFAAELSARQYARAVDAILSDDASFFAEPASFFATISPLRRRLRTYAAFS